VNLDFDCNTCGACCETSADWPKLTDADRGADGPPPEMVTPDGYMACQGDRCGALDGVVGVRTGCRIYERRPQPCRICQPGDQACLVARRKHGLWVPDEPTDLDAIFSSPTASRAAIPRRTRSSRGG
jgi:Fe-S-cluster containining protein